MNGEKDYNNYLKEIKRITTLGIRDATSVKDKLEQLNKGRFLNYAKSTKINKKFVYNTQVGNSEDTELAFYNYRTENPSDLDLTRKINQYEIKDEGDKVDYSIFLFPIIQLDRANKKVVSTSIFFPQTMIFNGKGFNYVTGIIKAVETFKARMGEGWIYRIYYDSMIDLYSNEYETQLKEFINTKFPKGEEASHYNTQFVENESKGCHKNVRDMMRILRNFFEYIKRNSYYDFVELYAFDAPLTRMFPYLDKHILYESNDIRFRDDKFRPYIGHPQTFGSMMRFFPLFDNDVEKVFFVNSSHSITPILAHFIKKWENEPYLCIPCWQTWTSNPSCIDTMQYQLKTIIFLLCGQTFYGGTGTSLTSDYQRVTNIIKDEEFESNPGGQPTITRVYDMNFGYGNTSRANSGSSGSSVNAASGPVPNQDTEEPQDIKDFLKEIGIVQEIGITKDTEYLVYLLEGKWEFKTKKKPFQLDNGNMNVVFSAATTQTSTCNTNTLIEYLKGVNLQSKTFINVIKENALNEILGRSTVISHRNFNTDLTYNTTRDYNRIYENLRLLLMHTGYTDLEEIKTTNGKLFTDNIKFINEGIQYILDAQILPESIDDTAVTERKRKYEIEINELQSQIRRVTGKKFVEGQGLKMELFNNESNDPYIRSRQEKIKRINGYKEKLPNYPEFWYGDDLKLIMFYKRMFIINLLEILVKKHCGLKLPTYAELGKLHEVKKTLGDENYRYENSNVDYGSKLKDFDLDDLYSLCSFKSLIDLSIVYDENFVILDDIAERIKNINLLDEGTKSLQLHSILILEDYEIIKFFLDIKQKNEDLNFDEYINDFFNERNRFIDFLCEFSVEKFDYLKDHPDNKEHNLGATFSTSEANPTVLEKETSVYNSPYYDNLGIPVQPKYFFDSHDLPYIDFKICRLFAGLTGVNLKEGNFTKKEIRETKFLECCGYINNFTYSIDELILTLVLIPEIQQEKSFLEEKKKWMEFYIKKETKYLFTSQGATGHRLQTELFVKSMANYVAYLNNNQNHINPNTNLLQHFTNFTIEEFNLIAGIVDDDEPGRSVTGFPTRYVAHDFGPPPPRAMAFDLGGLPSSPPLGLPIDPLFAVEDEEPYENENPEYIFRNILDIGEREGDLFMGENYIDIFMKISIRNDDFIKHFNHLGLTKYYQTIVGNNTIIFDTTVLKEEEMCKIDLSVYAKEKNLEYLLRDDEEMVEAGIIDQDFKDMIVEKFLKYIYEEGEINPDRIAYDIASFKKTLFFTHRYIPRSFLNYGDLSNQLAIRTSNFQGTSPRIYNLLPSIGVEKYIVKSGLINFLNSFDEIRPIMIVDINFSSLRELSIIIIYLLIKFKFKKEIIVGEFKTIFSRVSTKLQLDNYKYLGAIPNEILNFFKIVISNAFNINDIQKVINKLDNPDKMNNIVEKCVKFLSLYDIHSSSKVQLSDILGATGLTISSKSVIISKPLCLMG